MAVGRSGDPVDPGIRWISGSGDPVDLGIRWISGSGDPGIRWISGSGDPGIRSIRGSGGSRDPGIRGSVDRSIGRSVGTRACAHARTRAHTCTRVVALRTVPPGRPQEPQYQPLRRPDHSGRNPTPRRHIPSARVFGGWIGVVGTADAPPSVILTRARARGSV
jgi:hypothetical protein